MKEGFVKLSPDIHPFVLPVVLVTSKLNEKENLLAVAWFGVMCSEPPMVSVSIRPGRTSYPLLKSSGFFGLCLPPKKILKEVDFCGTYPGSKFDKFKKAGLTVFYGEKTGVPLIKECLVNAECMVHHIIRLGTHDAFIAQVVNLFVREELIKNNKLDSSTVIDALLYCHPQFNYYSVGGIAGKRGEGK